MLCLRARGTKAAQIQRMAPTWLGSPGLGARMLAAAQRNQPELRNRCRHSPRHGGHAPSIKKEVFSFSSKNTWMALSGSSPWRREKQAEHTRAAPGAVRPPEQAPLAPLPCTRFLPPREAKRLQELTARFCQHSWEQEKSREAVLAARTGLSWRELGDLHGVWGEAWEGSGAARAVGVLTKPSLRSELRKNAFPCFHFPRFNS